MKNNELKIAIVHEFLLKIGGAEKVLLSLLKLYPNADIFTFLYDNAKTQGLFKNRKIITSNLQNNILFNKKPKFLLSKYPKAIEEFDLSDYDIVISISSSFAHGVITKPKTFHICYCNSPMRYVWDWYFNYLSENHLDRGIKSLFIRNILHKIRIWDKVSADRVDLWIANSKNVSDRIKKYYRKNSKIIFPPVETARIQMSETIPDSYYVIVSRLEPYKKIDLAIKAFNQNKKQLIIIGLGSQLNKLKKISNKNIEFLGWQSNKSVYEYLRNSKGLIFPGEEDFGITPIEAMACGRPVVAYSKGGVLETVIDNKTGVFFDEETVESLNGAIDKLEENYTDFFPSACRAQSEKFSEECFNNNINETINAGYEHYMSIQK